MRISKLSLTSSAQHYTLSDKALCPVSEVRDLGIHLDDKIFFASHYKKISSKAYSRAYLVLKSFVSNDPILLVKAFCVYVRSLLEFSTQLWNPQKKIDILLIERVQKYFTRKVCKRCKISYSDYSSRLDQLNLNSLERRRLIFDLTFMYKIFHGLVDVPITDFFSRPIVAHSTRGHSYKVCLTGRANCNVRAHFFNYRIINVWNSLPESIVNASSLASFKSKIREFDVSSFCKLFP